MYHLSLMIPINKVAVIRGGGIYKETTAAKIILHPHRGHHLLPSRDSSLG